MITLRALDRPLSSSARFEGLDRGTEGTIVLSLDAAMSSALREGTVVEVKVAASASADLYLPGGYRTFLRAD